MYCQGLIVACPVGLACVMCGQRYTVRSLACYTNDEWAALVSEGLVRVSGELH